MPAAVEELKRCAGTQFDPQMVRALARGLDRHGWSTASTVVTADETVPAPRVGEGAGAGTVRRPVRQRSPDGLEPAAGGAVPGDALDVAGGRAVAADGFGLAPGAPSSVDRTR